MNKSLKEIADELGIDKQKVYRYIKTNHINEALQDGQVKRYDEAVQEQIKSHFLQNTATSRSTSKPHHEAVNDAVIEALKLQLKEKDEQIAESQKQITNLIEAVTNAQKLQGIAEQKLKMIEDKTQKEESAEEEQKKQSAEQELKLSDLQSQLKNLKTELEAEKNKSWWDKLRGK